MTIKETYEEKAKGEKPNTGTWRGYINIAEWSQEERPLIPRVEKNIHIQEQMRDNEEAPAEYCNEMIAVYKQFLQEQ